VHHLIEGGFDGGGGQRPALEVWDGTVGWSGVSMSPPEVTWPMTVPAEPYFLIVGGDQPGGERRLQAFGAQGLPFLAYFCTGPAAVELPGVLGERLLVAPDKLFAVRATTLQGQHTAAGILLPLPSDPGLAGSTLDVQGLALTPLGAFLTNAHQLVLRF